MLMDYMRVNLDPNGTYLRFFGAHMQQVAAVTEETVAGFVKRVLPPISWCAATSFLPCRKSARPSTVPPRSHRRTRSVGGCLGCMSPLVTEGFSAGNLSRGVVPTSPGISQRVLLPLQPSLLGTRTPHAPTQRLPNPHSGQTENSLEAYKFIPFIKSYWHTISP